MTRIATVKETIIFEIGLLSFKASILMKQEIAKTIYPAMKVLMKALNRSLSARNFPTF